MRSRKPSTAGGLVEPRPVTHVEAGGDVPLAPELEVCGAPGVREREAAEHGPLARSGEDVGGAPDPVEVRVDAPGELERRAVGMLALHERAELGYGAEVLFA